jgi:hypothetical protein
MSLDINLTNVQSKPIVVSANQTAENDRVYNVIANATFTDPTGVNGKGYFVVVRSGASVVLGGNSYTAGETIYRIFNAGTWLNIALRPSTYESLTNKKTTLTDNSDTFYPTQKAVKTAVDLKVDVVAGKGLSENDFTNTLKTKLDGIQAGAEVNVNADWNAVSGDAQILNKPTIPDTSDFVEKSDFTSHSILAKQSGASDPVAVSIGNNEILGRKSGGGSDIEGLSVSDVKSLLGYTASDVGAVATNSAITGSTKTKISYDAKGLVTSGADATTADIADSSNKRYVTDANLTVIGNTSGTNTGDETQNSILAKLGFWQYNRVAESSAITGTIVESIIENITIPANTYLNGGILRLYNLKVRKVGAVGVTTAMKIYISPNSNNLSGATQIGVLSGTLFAGTLFFEMLRTFTCTTTSLLGLSFTASSNTDTITSTVARGSIAVDWTVNQYIIITIQAASISDSYTMIGASAKNF